MGDLLGMKSLLPLKKSAPTLVFTFSAQGGLNQVSGLDLTLFLEALVPASGWYTSLWLYPAFSRAAWYSGAAALKISRKRWECSFSCFAGGCSWHLYKVLCYWALCKVCVFLLTSSTQHLETQRFLNLLLW